MTARRLDGRLAADTILRRLKKTISRLEVKPRLATIEVGDRFDSALYVRLKRRAANEIGLKTISFRLPGATSQSRLTTLIHRLNKQSSISGILLQLPLPAKLNTQAAINVIDPRKDVDGFHPNQAHVTSPTLAAILTLAQLAKPRRGLAVILGRRSILAKQLAAHLVSQGYSVRVTSTRWSRWTRRASLIITMLGHGPKLMAKQVSAKAVVIDVGIRSVVGKTVGDVDPSVWHVAKAISPVPGGVGPLTIAYVLKNCVTLHQSP